MRAAAARALAVNATAVVAAASEATAAAAAAITAADARLNWKFIMMQRLAAGAIRQVAVVHKGKLPTRLPRAQIESRLPFAGSPDLWEALAVPPDFHTSAGKILQGILSQVEQEIQGSTWVSTPRFARFRLSHTSLPSYRWYSISEAALARLEEVVRPPEALETDWQSRASRAKMDPASLRKAGDEDLNCQLCRMPVLNPDLPHYAERANAIAHLCHGDGWRANAIAHLCNGDGFSGIAPTCSHCTASLD